MPHALPHMRPICRAIGQPSHVCQRVGHYEIRLRSAAVTFAMMISPSRADSRALPCFHATEMRRLLQLGCLPSNSITIPLMRTSPVISGMAHSGHASSSALCPLSGVKRTWRGLSVCPLMTQSGHPFVRASLPHARPLAPCSRLPGDLKCPRQHRESIGTHL